ncbi:MAG: MarC family protein [Halioglobus sp.]|nr:MarC family protein [Halioglobus sp.]MBP6723311.1 MarC family protein [Halioglobus sp.]
MNWDSIVREFIALWVVIDPIGSIPVFIAVTAGLSAAAQRKVAIRAIVVSAVILLFFLVGGQVLLEALDIHLAAFQIAGGIVLFLFALTMIFGESKVEEEKRQIDPNAGDLAIFPLAVPSIASPGAMLAVVMLTDNHRYSVTEQIFTAATMLTVLGMTLLLFFMAAPILRVIGSSGASIVSRVMGLILASVAVDNILRAVTIYFNLS